MTPGRTQRRLTSIKRNRDLQSQRLSAVIPHTRYHTPRSTTLRDASSCDNVLMTTQHVTVATKLNLPPVRFRQTLCPGASCNKKKRSSPQGNIAAEFQVVAAVLMLNVSYRSRKGQMKLQGDPSITYRINAGSFSAVSAPSFAHSVTTYRGSGGDPISHRYVVIHHR